MKKIICLMLSLLMIISMATAISPLAISVKADSNSAIDIASLGNALPKNYTQSGTCGDNAYWGYYEDTKTLVIAGEGKTSIGAWSATPKYAQYPFEKAVVSEGITVLGSNMFAECSYMKEVSLPDSLEQIYDYIFYNCSALQSVTIPKNVKTIGIGLFFDCPSLVEVKVDPENTVFDSRDNCNAIIRTEEKFLHAGIKTTKIPESVTIIGGGSFWGCSGLVDLVIPDNITDIRGNAFVECKDLETVVMSSSVENIGANAFIKCSKLKSVVLSEKLEFIEMLFGECESLESITIPDSVKNIAQSSFSSCKSLRSVDFGNGVEVIGPMAFSGCTSLKTVSVPASVESIMPSAFAGCTALESITINNPQCSISDYARTIPENAIIYGFEGSTAQAYAQKYDRVFKIATEPEYRIGDADLDGYVTVMDATAIQKHIAQIDTLSDTSLSVSDTDADNVVTVLDATEIQRFVALLIPSLPRPVA